VIGAELAVGRASNMPGQPDHCRARGFSAGIFVSKRPHQHQADRNLREQQNVEALDVSGVDDPQSGMNEHVSRMHQHRGREQPPPGDKQPKRREEGQYIN
jgi:hypothetical protein